ncbi:MAG TPA: hypothetical protein VEB86_13685 [Chryseosolibacter sp.]|nr:hypothetical protein [Chryseosolibacter sp.]
MRLYEVFRFELAYQVRRPWPWLFIIVLIALTFLMSRDGSVSDVMFSEFFLNAPFLVALTTVFGTLIWMVMAAAVAGDAAARDATTRMYALTYTTGVSKGEYLGGKFLAALVLNAVILLSVQAGILLGVYLPGVHPDLIGPFRPAAFLTAYAYISMPNAFFATAIQFLLALKSGRAMAAYFGSFLLIFTGFFVASLLLFKHGLGTLLDPIGIRFVVEDIARLWTPHEKNWRLLEFEGIVLENRLLWIGIGVFTAALTYITFRFAHRTSLNPWMRLARLLPFSDTESSSQALALPDTAGPPISVPRVHRTSGFAIHVRQTLAIASTSFRAIAGSWAGLAMLAGIPLLTVPVVLDQMFSMGTPMEPTTLRVIGELTGSLSDELSRWVVVPFLIAYFAGELVWRERDVGMGEITDAIPGSEWIPVLGKFFGLVLTLVVFMTLLMAAGIVAQTILDYRNYEIGLYLKTLLGFQITEYLLFAMLAFVVHVVVNDKYLGHMVSVIAFVFIAMASLFGVEHNMLIYAGGPIWSYTEMRGFGPTTGPWLWFKLYWLGWALLLAVAATLMWPRGRERTLRVRLQVARRRITPATLWAVGVAAALILTVGGFIFYNTNILNDHRSKSATKQLFAEYERRYRKYENIVQPRLVATKLYIELYPVRREIDIRGVYELVNASAERIGSVHVSTAAGSIETRSVTFDRAATAEVNDAEHGYRIYALEEPLEPGDTLELKFQLHAARRGFGNRGVDPSLVENGSYFTNVAWFPMVGYQRRRELLSPSDRRAYELEPRPVLASLYEVEGREPAARGGGILFEAIIGTDPGEVAVAPGALQRTWNVPASANDSSRGRGRSYFHYATDAPIGDEWAFFSADYAVRKNNWVSSENRRVTVRIFHDPKHTAHVDHMMGGVIGALEFYSKQFGPYPYGHLNVVEHPGAPGTGMHADASMIYYGQGLPTWRQKNELRLDLPYAIMGHEMGHQWTLPYALVEGLPFLSEGLAWYFGIQFVRDSRGDEQARRLLRFMRQPHPHAPIRRGEPLLRALDPYLAYRRGPMAMYALSEYIGSQHVNGAIRRLIENHDKPGAPLATTLHLYRELQAITPDSLNYLLHDLFETNTYWSLKTDRVSAIALPDSTWQVTLNITAAKTMYDSLGVESDVAVDEWLPIGVFASPEPGHDEVSAPIYYQKHRIRSGAQTITITVPRKPIRAGIDPYHVLDWDEPGDDDNLGEF